LPPLPIQNLWLLSGNWQMQKSKFTPKSAISFSNASDRKQDIWRLNSALHSFREATTQTASS